MKTMPYPFIVYPGGKSSLVKTIHTLMPINFNSYYEPFVGSGALLFSIHAHQKNDPKYFISDINIPLILAYQSIKSHYDTLVEYLEILWKDHEKQNKLHFSRIKNEYNSLIRISDDFSEEQKVRLAAIFIYLSKSCYCGLWRVNSLNKFNSSMKKTKLAKLDIENLSKIRDALNYAEIKNMPCTPKNITADNGDLVYCDPPYLNTFDKYTNVPFTKLDHHKLAIAAQEWLERGAYVMISSGDCREIRALYSNEDTWNIVMLKCRRGITDPKEGRQNVEELIIVSKNITTLTT